MRPAYREIDFLKERLGIEVQFGKYAFMVYNVCAKMTIFRNLGYIDAGIEIVPVKSLRMICPLESHILNSSYGFRTARRC